MKKTLNQFFFTCFSCIFLLLLLFNSKECISLASNGLLIWYRNMIPTLFPFMVLSGFMIKTGLSMKIGLLLQPILGLIFRLPPQMLYAIFMGFLCGFPMGAKIVADMLEKGQITPKEGEYLLAFCNNIGPLYMLGYVIPLFNYKNIWTVLGLMYLIPLGYGLFLRYFSSLSFTDFYSHKKTNKTISNPSEVKRNFFFHKTSATNTLLACSYNKNSNTSSTFLLCFQQALTSAIEQITLLGGCMVFFNCLLIFPFQLDNLLSKTAFKVHSGLIQGILCSLIEIGGGLKLLAASLSGNTEIFTKIFLPLSLLTFGGISCVAQTCFILKNTDLKISTYIKHKFIQTCIFIILIFI